MMKFNLRIFLLAFALIFLSCKKDDETTTSNINPLAFQVVEDHNALAEFLSTHYYNEEEFANAGNITNFDYKIEYSTEQTVTGYDSNGDGVVNNLDIDDSTVFTRTALIDLVETQVITLYDAVWGNNVDHNLYILRAFQGNGAVRPNFCDEAYLIYEGMNLEKDIFDNNINPTWLDLTTTVRGFTEGVKEFNIADNFSSNGDGTFSYSGFGSGAVFMPSGLGYYASAPGNIGSYSPLIFNLRVISRKLLDHDGDGVLTIVEDLNTSGILQDDDSDLDGLYNYGDIDDDGDSVPTRQEVTIEEERYATEAMIPVYVDPVYEIGRRFDETMNEYVVTTSTLKDTNGNGVPDYLDIDDDGDGILTINEDADGDGQVTDDDTDGDGTPDYLDTDN